MEIGTPCGHDMDCSDVITGSFCSMAGYCECKPYYAQFNDTTCVQGKQIQNVKKKHYIKCKNNVNNQ